MTIWPVSEQGFKDEAPDCQARRPWDWDEENDGPDAGIGWRGRRQSLFGRRAHQRDCISMANKLRQLRVVPKSQREHVAGATDDNGFPPTIVKGFLGNDEMPRRDLVPGPG
jgi:hypothetical protein